ncbi:MAG: hypothetical protein ACW97X_08815 [Candidatus Hodarchaeales archaeon]|jgi:hypothetical protein
MQKIKLVFIDFQKDKWKPTLDSKDEIKQYYTTFSGYEFDDLITSRVVQLFGWTTDLLDQSINPNYEISIHVIFMDYLRKHGITQLFISRHGKEFDDVYSYIEGMSLLAFEGISRAHTIYTINSILRIIKYSAIDVPVDKPTIRILTPSYNLDSNWVKRLEKKADIGCISDDIQLFLKEVSPYHFIDYSLSRNYHHTLKEYIRPLENILNII